jgi:hypothetical protein
MPPGQQAYPPQQPTPQHGGQYDFILNPAPKPKKTLIPTGGSSRKQRILTVVLGGGAFLVLIIAAFSFILGSGGGQKELLISLAQEQQEIIRIADIGASKGRSRETREFAQTVKMSITSDQTETRAQLQKYGKKLNSKDLALKLDAKTTALLTTADRGNNFDAEMRAKLEASLETYKANLKTAHETATNTKEKDLLKKNFDHITVILPEKTSS